MGRNDEHPEEGRREGAPPEGPPRCELCGDVIGIYEPVVVIDGEARETSRAAEPEIVSAPVRRYHRACFALA